MTSSTPEPRNVRFWTPARLALTLITLALVASLFVASCTGPAQVANNNSAPTGQPPGRTVPANNPNAPTVPTEPVPATLMNRELKLLDGSNFKLADFQGKIILVNLWATWCGPCRSEVPDLIKVANEYGPKGVEVVGLTNEDPVADAAKVKSFVEHFKINYKIAWGDQEFAMGLMQAAGQIRNNIPQSFIIGRDGRILKRFIGFSQTETPPKLRQALEEALQKG